MEAPTYYALSIKSENHKTGPMPVSTQSNDTCPDICPWKKKGCFAEYGPLSWYWKKLSAGMYALTLPQFCTKVAALLPDTVWRYAQGGDLPGKGNRLNIRHTKQIAKANQGRRGFTFTHKPLWYSAERLAVKFANTVGFTINLSANSPSHADTRADLGIGPVALTVPLHVDMPTYTPAGRKITQCPAQTHNLTCQECQLCTLPFRKTIIAFRAHGAGAKYIQYRDF